MRIENHFFPNWKQQIHSFGEKIFLGTAKTHLAQLNTSQKTKKFFRIFQKMSL